MEPKEMRGSTIHRLSKLGVVSAKTRKSIGKKKTIIYIYIFSVKKKIGDGTKHTIFTVRNNLCV